MHNTGFRVREDNPDCEEVEGLRKHFALQRAHVKKIRDAHCAAYMRRDVAHSLQHIVIYRPLAWHRKTAKAIDAFCQYRKGSIVIPARRDDLVVEACLEIALASQCLLSREWLVNLNEPTHRNKRV